MRDYKFRFLCVVLPLSLSFGMLPLMVFIILIYMMFYLYNRFSGQNAIVDIFTLIYFIYNHTLVLFESILIFFYRCSSLDFKGTIL